jgi:hypothetical protein
MEVLYTFLFEIYITPHFSDAARRQAYEAMTTMLDDVLKSVVQALKDKDMWDNTLFIFSSDVRVMTCGLAARAGRAGLLIPQMYFILSPLQNGGPSGTDADSSSNYPLRGGECALCFSSQLFYVRIQMTSF